MTKSKNIDISENVDSVERLISQIEDAAQTDDDSQEYWLARDLQKILGYSDYRNFINIINKAKIACHTSNHKIEYHFVDVTEMIDLGKGAVREVGNIQLSRYACYLVAQNGDSRKQPIAFAQTYFAIQTRKQELGEQAEAGYASMSEDERRIAIRNDIREHNKKLASAAKDAGAVKTYEFSVFQTYGYKGLYGGLDVQGIRRKKKLTAKQQILDHMGSTELAANLFRATQTEEKLRRDNIKGKENANKTHFEVGAKVRQTIREIGGDMPETLPPAEDVKKVERRLKKSLPKNPEK